MEIIHVTRCQLGVYVYAPGRFGVRNIQIESNKYRVPSHTAERESIELVCRIFSY